MRFEHTHYFTRNEVADSDGHQPFSSGGIQNGSMRIFASMLLLVSNISLRSCGCRDMGSTSACS